MKKIIVSVALAASLLGISWAQAPVKSANLVWDAQPAYAATAPVLPDDFAWD